MDGETFIRHCRPVVLDGTIKDWPASSWTPEYLSEQVPEIVSCKVAPISTEGRLPWESECVHENVSVDDFVQWLRGTVGAGNPLHKYGRHHYSCYIDYKYMQEIFVQSPQLLKAVSWDSLGLGGRGGEDSTLWMGSDGAFTNCHYDTYGFNLVAQIYGRKRWLLFPPSDTPYLYPTRIPFEESSVFSQVNVRNPDLRLHPKFKLARAHEVVLEPGQVLYVPRHWWHFVECVDPAISINTWVKVGEDTQSSFEEAITRTLFSSLWKTHTRRQGSAGVETRGKDWVNTSEEIWDNCRNMMVLNATFQSARENTRHLETMSGSSCDGDSCSCGACDRHRGGNLELFARHFRGKSVHFPQRVLSRQCAQANMQGVSTDSVDEQPNLFSKPSELLKNELYFDCNLKSETQSLPSTLARVVQSTGSRVMETVVHTGNTYCLKRKLNQDKLDEQSSEKCKTKKLDCGSFVDHGSEKMADKSLHDLSDNDNVVKDISELVTSNTSSAPSCCHDDHISSVTDSLPEVTLTAVTATLQIWNYARQDLDSQPDGNTTRSCIAEVSPPTREMDSYVDRCASSSPSEVRDHEEHQGSDEGSGTLDEFINRNHSSLKSCSKTLTFEDFVVCATHPHVITVIGNVLKDMIR